MWWNFTIDIKELWCEEYSGFGFFLGKSPVSLLGESCSKPLDFMKASSLVSDWETVTSVPLGLLL
jgi:hypothetical protein